MYVVTGAVVGWVVSLLLGRDFEGGCIAYVIIGIVTMVVLGLLIRLLWALLLIGLVLIAAAWLYDLIRARSPRG